MAASLVEEMAEMMARLKDCLSAEMKDCLLAANLVEETADTKVRLLDC